MPNDIDFLFKAKTPMSEAVQLFQRLCNKYNDPSLEQQAQMANEILFDIIHRLPVGNE